MPCSAAAAAPPPLPASMRAVLYGADRAILRPGAPLPRVGPREVLVRVHSAGLNPVDAKLLLGDKVPAPRRTGALFRRLYLRRCIPGIDFSGTVVRAPANDDGGDNGALTTGDEVFGTVPPMRGTLAEYVAAPIDQVCRKPRALSFPQAAALPLVGLTALQCLTGLIVPGQSHVLIVGGGGGAGHVALQVAHALGARRVAAVGSPRSAALCRACGADAVLDYTAAGTTPDLPAQLREEAVEGGPFDVVLDCVTSADPRDRAPHDYPALLQQGRDQAGDLPPWLAPDYAYRRLGGPPADWFRAGLARTTGLGLWPSPRERLFWIRLPGSAVELQQLADWAEDGRLAPRIGGTFDFSAEGVQAAMDALLERRVQGKVVVNLLN